MHPFLCAGLALGQESSTKHKGARELFMEESGHGRMLGEERWGGH